MIIFSTSSDTVLKKIVSFSTLKPGWHLGDGGPIPDKTISLAITVVSGLRQFGNWDIDAFAGSDGEISLVSTYGRFDIEVIIENDDSMSVAYDFDRRQASFKSGLRYQQAIKEVAIIVGKAWITSEYFTRETTTLRGAALLASHLETLGGAYLLSIMNVYNSPARVFPTTSAGITKILPQNRQYSGNSTREYFHHVIA